ncbi:MAG: hypothetical protein AAF628_08325 [Planctomycetota bacterium]
MFEQFESAYTIIAGLLAGGAGWGAHRTRIANLEKDVERLESLPAQVAAINAKLDLIVKYMEAGRE